MPSTNLRPLRPCIHFEPVAGLVTLTSICMHRVLYPSVLPCLHKVAELLASSRDTRKAIPGELVILIHVRVRQP